MRNLRDAFPLFLPWLHQELEHSLSYDKYKDPAYDRDEYSHNICFVSLLYKQHEDMPRFLAVASDLLGK